MQHNLKEAKSVIRHDDCQLPDIQKPLTRTHSDTQNSNINIFSFLLSDNMGCGCLEITAERCNKYYNTHNNLKSNVMLSHDYAEFPYIE